MQQYIIGLCGSAGSGKDTVAAVLVKEFGFHHDWLASPIKRAAAAIFGFTANQLYGKYKEAVDEFWGISPREVMQRMGTEAMRGEFGDDVWIRALARRVANKPKVVISDVRFDNEAQWILGQGGIVWRIHRPDTARVREHVSEQGVSPELISGLIFNTSTIEDLHRAVVNKVGGETWSPSSAPAGVTMCLSAYAGSEAL